MEKGDDNIKTKEITEKFGVSEITAEILKQREIDDIYKFLNPSLSMLNDPADIPNIDEVKQLVKEHIEWGNKIVIATDYDQDGCSSAAVMYTALNRLGANVEVIVGDRHKYGYGLPKNFVDDIDNKNADLIITLDMGIAEKESIEYAKNKNMDVIVIDHHLSDEPPNCPFIDLKVEQGDYPFSLLSAAGVTWKVAQYILNDSLVDLLDIVTLSTIGDLVSLIGENRIIATAGLDMINNNPSMGVDALIQQQRLDNTEMTAGHVGYSIVPMINARQRLKGSNQISFELLTTKDKNKIKKISQILYETNKKRQKISNECVQKAREQVNKDDNITVIKDNIPSGIVGLVAGDLKEKFDKPAIVFGEPNEEGICKGSFRSYQPLTSGDIFDAMEGYYISGGGHHIVGGCSLNKKNYNIVKDKLLKKAKGIKYKKMNYDLEIAAKDVNYQLVKELDIFEPCGMGNPSPKFLFKEPITNIKTTKSGKHLMFKIGGISAIAFGEGDRKENVYNSEGIIGSLDINEYKGRENIQIKVKRIL